MNKTGKKLWLTLTAILALSSAFTFNNNVQAAKHKKKDLTPSTELVQGQDSWNYPFNKDIKNGVHPMYEAQTFGITDYIRSYNPLSYFHDGWDFGISEVGKNATVKAIHPGTVKKVAYGNGLGWFVWVTSPDKYVEIYQEGFASKNDIKVKAGQEITTGQKIGKLTGTHLHLGLTKTNHKYINQNGFPCNNWNHNVGTWLNPIKTIQKNLK